MTPWDPAALAPLSLLVFFAGVVDSLAGGGGLITLPAFLAAGVPPALLLGTNKLASSIGTVASALRYGRALAIELPPFLPAVTAALAGAVAGARLTLLLDPAWLRPLLLAALPAVAAAVLLRRRPPKGRAASGSSVRAAAVGLAIGAYDGFFGPGTGTFFALALARFCGYDLLGATARAKILNLASNVAALAAFLHAGRVDWRLGAAMGAVSVAGHVAGASLGLRRGAEAIRPALALVCGGLFLKLALDAAAR